MALDPDISDLVPGFLLQCLFPQVGVQGRGAVGLFPAPALPAPGPALFQPVDDVLAVRAQPHLTGLLELAQGLDKGGQLHPVVGGGSIAAAELFFVHFAIEPMVDLGSAEVVWMDDDWTVVTEDWSLSAHYENTILITDGEPEIFTLTESEIATGRWNQYLGRQTEA